MQTDLRRLPHRADEQQDAGEFERRYLPSQEIYRRADRFRRFRENDIEIERAEDHKNREDAEGEAEIADSIDDKGLYRGIVRGGAIVPEADQQIRGQPDAFPAEEQLDEIVGR